MNSIVKKTIFANATSTLHFMKKYILGFIVLLSSLKAVSQINDLFQLAQGSLVFFTPIFEPDDKLYGYIGVYDLGKENESQKRYEYVILDTRLVKVTNGEFLAPSYKKIYSRFVSLQKLDNKLLLSRLNIGYPKTIFSTHNEIRLDTTNLTKSFYFQNNEFIEGHRDEKTVLKNERKLKTVDFLFANHTSLINVQTQKNLKDIDDINKVVVFSAHHEPLWETSFLDEKGEKSKYLSHSLDYVDDALLIFLEENKRTKTLQVFDAVTGKKMFNFTLEDRESKYNFQYKLKRVDNQLIIVGEISNYDAFGFKQDRAVGLFKKVLDMDGQIIQDKTFLWSEAASFMEIKKNGKVEDGYRLYPRDYFISDDGSVAFLTEKFKMGYNLMIGSVPKTTDFVLFKFNQDFNLVTSKTIHKDKSKFSYSDYLFSQHLKEQDATVFFYRDFQKDDDTKEKNWVLGIVKLKGDAMDYEEIPISSEDYFIQPYIAKEGYILLREFNKNQEHNQIRLEKINLD